MRVESVRRIGATHVHSSDLSQIQSPSQAAILDAQANLLTDVDGNRLISIAIIASAGVDSSSAAGPGIMQGDDGSSDTGVVDQEERLASGKKMEDREEIVRILVRRWGILGGDTGEHVFFFGSTYEQ